MIVFTDAKEHAIVMHNADAIAAMRACGVRGLLFLLYLSFLPGAL